MPNTDLTFNTPSGQTIARELLIAYLNTGTATRNAETGVVTFTAS